MALKNIMELTGDVLIKTDYGQIQKGKDSFNGLFYVKVESIRSDKQKATAFVLFANEKIQFTKNYDFQVSVADGASNFIKQGYLYLKSLPEFANAEDC